MDCLPHIHTVAIHAEPGFRSVVPGIGVLCRKNDLLLGAGRYFNSVGRPSNYLITGYQPWHIGSVRFGAVAGVDDGYPFRDGHVIPLAAAVMSIPLSWGDAHVLILPTVGKTSPLTFQLSFTF